MTERFEQGRDGFFNVLSAARAAPTRVRVLDLHVEWRDGGLSRPPEDLATFVNLERLSLWGMTIVDLPEAIVHCKKLVSLDISGGSSRPFPARVFELHWLHDLRASDNQYYDSVPDRFAELPDLESLDLGECRLRRLPPSIGTCRKLRRLNVASNELRSLPDELAALEDLEELETDGNQIRERPAWLDSLKKLREHDF